MIVYSIQLNGWFLPNICRWYPQNVGELEGLYLLQEYGGTNHNAGLCLLCDSLNCPCFWPDQSECRLVLLTKYTTLPTKPRKVPIFTRPFSHAEGGGLGRRLAHIKLNSKWHPQLRLWACTIYRIGNGRSEACQKLWYRGPACHKMEQIYVSTEAICRGSAELASLNKRERNINLYHCLVQDVDDHFRRYLHAYK